MLPTALKIIKQLKKAGYEAYWAGGCVRDMLLSVKPKDFDIVTSAKPEEIEKVLERTIPVGKEFGVNLAIQDGHHFEVATFRSDSGYSDGRRPDFVTFSSAKEDAFRRDFTINGMFYDPIKDKVIDYVGGQKDLEAKLIRFIGDPNERINEDHLRILRAVRFKNQLGFQYEPATYQALCVHASQVIDKVSKERVGDELNKMLLTQNAAKAFEDMEDIGMLKILLPELQKMKGVAQPFQYHHEGDVWTHTMQALASLPTTTPLPVRWATLLHDVGKTETFSLKERIRFDGHAGHSKKIAQEMLNRLRYPRRFIEEVCWLVEHHMMMVQLLEMPHGRRMRWFLDPWFLNLMEVFKADAQGTTPTDLKLYEKILTLYRESVENMPKEPEPLLKGEDIMKKLKLKPGKLVGEILTQLREKQLGGEITNTIQAHEWLENLENKSEKSLPNSKSEHTSKHSPLKKLAKKSRKN